jgi:hypothetical protein
MYRALIPRWIKRHFAAKLIASLRLRHARRWARSCVVLPRARLIWTRLNWRKAAAHAHWQERQHSPCPRAWRRYRCRAAKKDHAVLIMGTSIAFLILALRSGAVGVGLLARFAHRPAFVASRATAIFPPRSRLHARPSTAPANKTAPATAIVRRQRCACRSATLRKFDWRAWKPDLPSDGFRFGRVHLTLSAERALRGDG